MLEARTMIPMLRIDIRSVTICPACHSELAWGSDRITCVGCSRQFSIVDGIPVLLVASDRHDHDELHRNSGHLKKGQAEYFDDQAFAEFEIERPGRAPALYGWLLEQKFRRSISGLEAGLRNACVLTVCGGSGMDAEFLARFGARVLCSDISLGAALRCRERALRHGLVIAPVVADVEHLPFRDGSFQICYVHDGLHHLADPSNAVGEMMRVSSQAISITEPASAAVTHLAVRLGLALEIEPAGNTVIRLEGQGLANALADGGYGQIAWGRYAMYYPHVPGRVFRLLSKPALLPAIKLLWKALNLVFGRWGNKLSIRAVRRETPAS